MIAEVKAQIKAEKEKITVSDTKEKVKLTYSEQLEWAGIEEEIMLLEEAVNQAKEEMLEFSSDFTKLSELQIQVEEKEAQLVAKWERYEYLSQYAGE